MRTIKLNHTLIILLGLIIGISSCNSDDPIEPTVEPLTLSCSELSTLLATGTTYTLENRGAGVDYIIDCKTQVNGDLIIEPGVTIAFKTDAGLWVRNTGSLKSIGTAEDPIIFTSIDKLPGDWLGIMIDSDDNKNDISHSIVEYAGGNAFNSNGDLGGILVWSYGNLTLFNTTIRNCSAPGINMNYGGANISMTDLTITACTYPMSIEANYASGIFDGDFTGNSRDAIKIIGTALTTSMTYEKQNVPYEVHGRIWAKDVALTIEPGITMEFEGGGSIEVSDDDQSALIAVGTLEDPILFTGVNKVAGAWKGFEFNFTDSPLNEIGFATIEYAGGGNQEGAIYMWANPTLNIHDVTFNNILTCSIYAAPNSTGSSPNVDLTTSTLTHNTVGGEICGD